MKEQFAVFGSDARQAAAGRALARAGYAVGGAEQLATADYLLLPMPLDAQQLGLCRLLRAAKPGALALGGLPGPDACRIAQQCGIELVDYYQEPLALRNAVPTAEGCIGLLLHHRTRTLAGSPVLVLGFRAGRAGTGGTLSRPGRPGHPGGTQPGAARPCPKSGHDRRPLDRLPALAPRIRYRGQHGACPGADPGGAGAAAALCSDRGFGLPPWRHGFCCRCPAGAYRPPSHRVCPPSAHRTAPERR